MRAGAGSGSVPCRFPRFQQSAQHIVGSQWFLDKWMGKESLQTIKKIEVIIRVVTIIAVVIHILKVNVRWKSLSFRTFGSYFLSVYAFHLMSTGHLLCSTPPTPGLPNRGRFLRSRIIPPPTWGSYVFLSLEPSRRSTDKPGHRAGVRIKWRNYVKPLPQGQNICSTDLNFLIFSPYGESCSQQLIAYFNREC